MKIVLATGSPRVNTQIENKFKEEVEIVGKPLYREAIFGVLEEQEPEVLILSDRLEGTLEIAELILRTRANFPHTRIIMITANHTPENKSFLYRFLVYDLLNDTFNEQDIRQALFKPKSWVDIAEEIPELKDFQKPKDLQLGKANLSEMETIDQTNYKKIVPNVTEKDSLYQEIVAFWSVLDQSGKTFSAVNTALFLASNKDLKILLIDFNIENPNVHLHFGFSDANKNLGALIEDIEEGRRINKNTLEHYLITHPVYKNLKILPGYILKMASKKQEYYIEIFEHIIKSAQGLNFSTILLDLSSGLESKLNVYILKSCTKILLHSNESPGSLYAIKRLFDPQVGQIVPNFINKKRIHPVINRATEEYHIKYKKALESIIEENRVVTIIKEDHNVHQTIFEGTPMLKTPTESSYITFLKLANGIHNGLFKVPKKPTPTPNSTKKTSFFGKMKK